MIKPEQIRAARALVDMSQSDLARMCRMSKTGIANIERGTSDPKASSLAAIQHALEEAGVRFTEFGVELRR